MSEPYFEKNIWQYQFISIYITSSMKCQAHNKDQWNYDVVDYDKRPLHDEECLIDVNILEKSDATSK